MESIMTRTGFSIEDGMIIKVDGKTYIATYIDKDPDDLKWIGHPCGSTPGDDIDLTEAIANRTIEIV